MIRKLLPSILCLAGGLVFGFILRVGFTKETLTSGSAVVGAESASKPNHTSSEGLSAPGRKVLAWLRMGQRVRDFSNPLAESPLEHLENVEALSSLDFSLLLPHVTDFARRKMLLERWAEVDPNALSGWIEKEAQLSDPSAASSGFTMVISNLPSFLEGIAALRRVDGQAAHALKRKIQGDSAPDIIAFQFVAGPTGFATTTGPSPVSPEVPDADPAAMSGADAWRWLKENHKTGDLGNLAEKMIEEDPARAAEWLEKMPLSYDRTSLLNRALLNATQENPDRLVQWLGKFKQGSGLKYALESCRGLNKSHFPKIETWALECREPDQRRAVIGWLAERYARCGPGGADALPWAMQLPHEGDRWVAVEAMAGLLPDAQAAAKVIAENAPALEESRALSALCSQWGARDPEAARSWAESLPAGNARSQAIHGVWTSWTQSDPAAAHSALPELTAMDRRTGVQAIAASRWALEFSGKAMRWMASLPQGEQIPALAASYAQWPASFWREALPMLERLATAPVSEADTAAFSNVIRKTTNAEIRRDAASASSWALALPPGSVRFTAIGTIAEHLAVESWEKANSWIATLPEVDRQALSN